MSRSWNFPMAHSRLLLPVLLLASAAAAQDAAPPAKDGVQLSTAERIHVSRFAFSGSTVFSEAQLAKVVAGYIGKDVTAEDLEEARRALTQFYVQAGYVNSGAVLEDQTIQNGIVTFKITEGVLTDIAITGKRHFATRYLRGQIKRGAVPPLNVIKLRDALELLRQNPNISQLNANVQPGAKPGEATLQVALQETNPSRAALELDNHRPPSVGAERLRLVLNNDNLTGWDDSVEIRTGLTRNGLSQSGLSNLSDFSLGYKSPAFLRDTRLLFNYSKGDTAVIEEPFRSLDITSKSENISVGLRQPLRRTLNQDVALTLTAEHRKSESFLFGIPFSFSRGDVDGVAETTAVRFGQEYLRREPRQVFAARSLISWGNNFPGSTKNTNPPSGQFLTWLLQLQQVRVLDEKGRQLVLRLDGQWSKDPLLSVEKFAIGGASSVRGYRENQLVRDRGLAASAELRVPVLYDRLGRDTLTLAPFFDFGYGRDVDAASSGLNHISSLGIGLIYKSHKRLNGQVYWGYALQKVQTAEHDLQDEGIHFALAYGL